MNWLIQRFGTESFVDNVVAGLLVLAIEVVFVVLIAEHVARRIERRLNENLWRPTRERLVMVLLRGTARVMGAVQTLMQAEGNKVYPTVVLNTHVTGIILALDTLDSLATLHLPAFTAVITTNVSDIIREAGDVRERATGLLNIYGAVRKDLRPLNDPESVVYHVTPDVFILDDDGRIKNTVEAPSPDEDARRYFAAALIGLSMCAEKWAEHVLDYVDQVGVLSIAEGPETMERVRQRVTRTKQNTRAAMTHGLWLAEYRMSRQQLEARS